MWSESIVEAVHVGPNLNQQYATLSALRTATASDNDLGCFREGHSHELWK